MISWGLINNENIVSPPQPTDTDLDATKHKKSKDHNKKDHKKQKDHKGGNSHQPWKKGGRNGEIDEHLEAMRCIYGHDSKLGLVERKWSTGLDGACVRGGVLHALVVEAGGRESIVSVGCE